MDLDHTEAVVRAHRAQLRRFYEEPKLAFLVLRTMDAGGLILPGADVPRPTSARLMPRTTMAPMTATNMLSTASPYA